MNASIVPGCRSGLHAAHTASRLEPAPADDKRSSGASTSAGDGFPVHGDPILPPSYPAKPPLSAHGAPEMEYDYEGTVRASYYGRRIYPSYDPANLHTCPVRFIRQFEHAAQHNGLHMRAWAKRMDSCLQGRAEDWAFDECPLEAVGSSWDARKRLFLDWALLPAEQELRRQRLARFYQTETDLSIDFVYTFEEAAAGLRDYKEDVWTRKCISNLLPPLRSRLFEYWTDGLPVRFRDLRDSLYAVDWSLYEAASGPLRVVKYGAPFTYESCSQALSSQPSTGSINASQCSSTERPSTSRVPVSLTGSVPNMSQAATVYSPPATTPAIVTARRRRTGPGLLSTVQQRALAPGPLASGSNGSGSPEGMAGSQLHRESGELARSPVAGISDLVSTLSRIPERERSILVAALGRLAAADEDGAAAAPAGLRPVTSPAATAAMLSPRTARSRGPLPGLASPTTVPVSMPTGGRSRAVTAAAVAAAAHQFASMEALTRPSIGPGAQNIEHYLLAAGEVARHSASRSRGRGASSCSRMSGADTVAPAPALRDHQMQPLSDRESSDSKDSADDNGKIRLRTRPLTSTTYERRRQSSPLLNSHNGGASGPASAKPPGAVGNGGGDGRGDSREAHQPAAAAAASPGNGTTAAPRTLARRLSSRKSDSALTTAARSHRQGSRYRDDSSEENMRSPEFTVLHPDLKRRTDSRRRGRFASALLRLLR